MDLQSDAKTKTTAKDLNGGLSRYGRYELLTKIATGGMGEIFLAHAIGVAGFQKLVVIKRILPHLVEQPHFVQTLVREAKLLLMLDHPNIIQVLDLGEEGGDYFMVMEFVNGYNFAMIAHYCAQQKVVIPTPACVTVGLGTLAALEYTHRLTDIDGSRHNIIHRDVSPQNVVISYEGRVKLTDFGIAKVLSNAEGEYTRTLKGKFRYMAPEALEGGRLDRRYDLFAVGVLLFEGLCRRHLFSGRSDAEILRQVKQARVPDISRYHPDASPKLVQVVNKSLSRKPEERFSSAEEFAAALRDAISPINDANANAHLKNFVEDLYNRPGFPVGKPKLPDLRTIEANVHSARSITFGARAESDQSKRSDESQTPVGMQRTSRVSSWVTAFALFVLAGVVAYLAYKMHTGQARSEKKDSVIIYTQGTHSSSGGRGAAAAPETETTLDANAENLRDAGSVDFAETKTVIAPRSKRPPRQPRVTRTVVFTREIGKRAFAKHGAAIKRCFDKNTRPGDPALRVEIASEIQRNGRVTRVSLKPAAQSNTPLGRCLRAVAKRVRYPRHTKDQITFLQPLAVKRSQP